MSELWDLVVPFAGTAPVLTEHGRALPQIDQLCGPFWARLALLTGTPGPGRLPSQVQAAEATGTQVHPALDADVRPSGQPPNRTGWDQLPRATAPAHAGTSGRRLAAGVGDLAAGRLEAVPVSGSWRPEQLGGLLAELADLPAFIIANIATAALWGSHSADSALRGYLGSGDDTGGPPPDWDVGHFVGIWGRIVGNRGTLVAVADTYAVLGSHGRHLQPLPRLARALGADSAHRGRGLLVVGEPSLRTVVQDAAENVGLRTAFWD